MKSLLPWLCALALLGGAVFLFTSNRKLNDQLAAAREEGRQVQALREELEQIKTTGSPAQAEELARLRKNNQELLQLRNQVRQLLDEKKQLSQAAQSAQRQAQSAQAQAQAAQAQVQTLSTNLQSAQAQAAALVQNAASTAPAALTPEQAAYAARYGLDPATVQAASSCINNLRQIDGAMQQWALEYKKDEKAVPTAQDIGPYLKDGVLPKCPGGGTYTLNAVGAVPTCSIQGHAMPR